MIYKKYGEIFRNLREHNGFFLSSFTHLDISKAALSKFERGETMMSFEKVISALNFMGVSLEEYEHFLNSYSQNESDHLIDEIENATFEQNKQRLKNLEIVAKQENYIYISLAAKASHTSLDTIEISKLVSRLSNLEFWSYKELCIFFLVMENLDTYDILNILNIFLQNKHNIFQSPKYRSYLVQSCCRAVTIFSSRKYKEYAEYVLNKLNSYELVDTMYLRNLRNLTRGYWTYCFEDESIGNTQMVESLKIFEEVSTPELYGYYLNRYNYFIKEKIKKQ